MRVNGRAAITRDQEILSSLAMKGRDPKVALGVEVEEAYFHCPKAFIRASLWAPSTWSDPQRLPSFAQMLWDQMPNAHGSDASVEEYESKQQKLIRDTLY